MASDKGLYIQMFSIHGLVRHQNMELGYDADTGGQIKYVVELCRNLSERGRGPPGGPLHPPDPGQIVF